VDGVTVGLEPGDKSAPDEPVRPADEHAHASSSFARRAYWDGAGDLAAEDKFVAPSLGGSRTGDRRGPAPDAQPAAGEITAAAAAPETS
jgi:hypothetical protein